MHDASPMNGESALFLGNLIDEPMQPSRATEFAAPSLSGNGVLPPVEIRKLTEAVKRGDEAAFTRFHELYGMRLYKLLLNIAHGREGDAREVLQAVMIKLTTRFEAFDEEARLWAWLCRVARHAYVDFYRAQRRGERFVPLEVAGDGTAEATPREDRLSFAFRAALDTLPAEDRELLRAFYIDKRPLLELAEEAGQTYKALESRMTRLRRAVKAQLLTHLQNEK